MIAFLLNPRTLLAIAAATVLLLLYAMVFKWPADVMIPARQEKLLRLVSDKKWRKCAPYLSDAYFDQWEFNKQGALLTLQDVGSQFLVLHVESFDQDNSVLNDRAEVRFRVRLNGSGNPLAQIIVSQANTLQDPFLFHWRKESWLPWSWRIVRIENESLPDDLYGYEPGDLRRALQQ